MTELTVGGSRSNVQSALVSLNRWPEGAIPKLDQVVEAITSPLKRNYDLIPTFISIAIPPCLPVIHRKGSVSYVVNVLPDINLSM
jgi:hypothetical protein